MLALEREPGKADAAAARALRRSTASGGFDIVHGHSSKAGALVRAALPRPPPARLHAALLLVRGLVHPRGRLLYRAIEQALVPRSGAIVAACRWERRAGAEALRGAAGSCA